MPPAVWSLLQNWECDTSMCLTCLCSPNSMGMTVKLNLGGSRPLAERRNDPFKGQGLTGAPGEGRVVWQVKRPQDPLPGLRGSICAAVRTRPRQAQGRRTPKPCPAPPNLPPRSMAHMSEPPPQVTENGGVPPTEDGGKQWEMLSLMNKVLCLGGWASVILLARGPEQDGQV